MPSLTPPLSKLRHISEFEVSLVYEFQDSQGYVNYLKKKERETKT